jgi:adenylate cyclase
MKIIETFRRRKERFYRSLAIALGVSLVVFLGNELELIQSKEAKVFDIFSKARAIIEENLLGWPHMEPSSEIRIIAIDDSAFAQLDRRQPLPRSYLAGLVDVVAKAGAKVIVWDIEFTAKTDENDDEVLRDAIKRATDSKKTKVVFSYFDSPRKQDTSTSNQQNIIFGDEIPEWTGFANLTMDSDEVVRTLRLVSRDSSGTVRPSLALVAVAGYSDYDRAAFDKDLARRDKIYLDLRHWNRQSDRLRPERTTFAFNPGDVWKIDFQAGAESFKRLQIASDRVFELAKNLTSFSQSNPFNNKIVLIGGTFADSRDFYMTPVGELSGVEIHAMAINTILSRSQIRRADKWLMFGVWVFTAVMISVGLTLYQPGTVGLLTLLSPVLIIPCYLALRLWGLWVDLFSPVVAIGWGASLAAFLAGRGAKQSITEFVSREVVDRIVEEERITSRKLEATILFADIRDFTTISEGWSPVETVDMLNDFFALAGEVLKKRRGYIVDFVGDGVFAVFGAPKDDPNHASNAVAAALDIQSRLVSVNASWRRNGLPALKVGVGIHTGEVVVGIVGSVERRKLGATGDPVNVAARVEELNKKFSTNVLITESTRCFLNETFPTRDLGTVAVKGRKEPVQVFEVLDYHQ